MKTGINLYLASEFEYRRGLAHKLLNDRVIDFCLADYLPYTEAPEHDDRIVTVNHSPSYDGEYDEVCDINGLPTVSKDLLEAMLPYESMAIQLGMRRFNYPSTEYDEEKRRYLQHVRYWNYMLDKYSINLIVTHCIPHSQGKYVIYALAQIKRIPFLMWHRSGLFDERVFWGTKLEGIGRSIGDRYLELTKNHINDFELEQDIDIVYQTSSREPVMTEKRRYDSSILNRHKKVYKSIYTSKKRLYEKRYIRFAVSRFLEHFGYLKYKQNEEWLRMTRRHLFAVRYYKRHLCCSLWVYNKMAEEPDYSKKYVVFLPHVTPEAVVMPLAGVFSEQFNAIQLLARAAEKKGCYVYVKEHPHSAFRSKDFYSEIASIHNVQLIKSSVSSFELIRNSVAVATIKGSCLIEAMGMMKPMLVFSEAYFFKECPGLYEIIDEDQCASIIGELINGFRINKEDVRRYFYAMQLESLKEVPTSEEYKRVFNEGYRIPAFPLDDRVELIRRTIERYGI